MDRSKRTALLRWLEAERRGDDRAAERALRGLWRGLGAPTPSSGFTRRTLARAGFPPPARGLRHWTLPGPKWVPRGALAAALGLVAVSITLLPASLVTLASAWDRLLAGAIGVVAAVSERLAHGLTAWNVATRISGSLIEGLVDPSVLAGLSAALLMSFFAFGWLSQLLAVERSSKHA